MSEGYRPIRSYQRLFRPERRLYAVEGRALPVPGGVPLRWMAWAIGTLVFALLLSSGSIAAIFTLALCAGFGGLLSGGRAAALLAGAAGFVAAWLLGAALGILDWPLRLVVVPLAVATLATQATPDGRRAERFAISWLALRLAPRRRSLGRALPQAGSPRLFAAEFWAACDEHSPVLRHALVHGPAIASFAMPVAVRRAARRRRLVARPASRRGRGGALVTERVALGRGEALEVRG